MALDLKVTDLAGKDAGSVVMDESLFGGFVKTRLLHAATVMYHNNLRQGSACTKTRAEIAGSTKKLYRQKGTGRARAGSKKSGTRKGGGVIHGPKPRNFVYHIPRKQRQAALRSALLAKAKDDELRIVKGLDFAEVKTKAMKAFLAEQGVSTTGKTDRALVATDGLRRNAYLSGRNLPGVTIKPAQEINARDVLLHKYLVIDQVAFERLNCRAERPARARKPKGTRKGAAGDVALAAKAAEAEEGQDG